MTPIAMGERARLSAESGNGDRGFGAGGPRVRSRNARFSTGRVMSGCAVLLLSFDGAMKVLRLPPALEATVQLGYPASVVLGLGVVLLVCVSAYVFPPTAVLGAILLTGYL